MLLGKINGATREDSSIFFLTNSNDTTCKFACSQSAAYLLQNYNFIGIQSKEYVLNFILVLSFLISYLFLFHKNKLSLPPNYTKT